MINGQKTGPRHQKPFLVFRSVFKRSMVLRNCVNWGVKKNVCKGVIAKNSCWQGSVQMYLSMAFLLRGLWLKLYSLSILIYFLFSSSNKYSANEKENQTVGINNSRQKTKNRIRMTVKYKTTRKSSNKHKMNLLCML